MVASCLSWLIAQEELGRREVDHTEGFFHLLLERRIVNVRSRVVGEGHLDGAVVADARVAATHERATTVEGSVDLVAPAVVGQQVVERLGEPREPDIEVGAFREGQVVDIKRHAVRNEGVVALEERGVERVAGELDFSALDDFFLHPSGKLERVVVLLVVVPDGAVRHRLERRDLFGLLGVARVTAALFLVGLLLGVARVALVLRIGLVDAVLRVDRVDGLRRDGGELLGLDDRIVVRALRQYHSADDQHHDAGETRDDLRELAH